MRLAWIVLATASLGWTVGPATAAAQAEPEPPTDVCQLWLSNGDMMTGRVESIGEGKAAFRPNVAPETVMHIDLRHIGRLLFDKPEEIAEPPRHGDLLELQDGSLIYGTFLGLTEGGLTFDIEQGGRFEFPRSATVRLRRLDARPVEAEPVLGHDVLVTRQGDILIGRAEPHEGSMIRIQGKAVEAVVALDSVGAMHFAADGQSDPNPTASGVLATLHTRRGTQLAGMDLHMSDHRLSVNLVGGQRIEVPLEQVTEVTISVLAQHGKGRIIVWGPYADADEELARTVGLLKEHCGDRCEIVEDRSEALGTDFQQNLMRSSAWVVPEMETWNPSANPTLAAQIKPVAEAFLRRGGTIVLLGVRQRESDIWRDAGLLDVQQVGSGDEIEVRFTADGRRIAQGVGKSFDTANGTYFYKLGPQFPSETWATAEAGSPIIARRIGRGWVILLGMDYYTHSPQTAQLLVNAVAYR